MREPPVLKVPYTGGKPATSSYRPPNTHSHSNPEHTTIITATTHCHYFDTLRRCRYLSTHVGSFDCAWARKPCIVHRFVDVETRVARRWNAELNLFPTKRSRGVCTELVHELHCLNQRISMIKMGTTCSRLIVRDVHTDLDQGMYAKIQGKRTRCRTSRQNLKDDAFLAKEALLEDQIYTCSGLRHLRPNMET